MDLQQLLHGAIHHFGHPIHLWVVCHEEVQGRAMCLHQFLPELFHEPLVLVCCNRQWKPVLADDLAEEGISNSVHVCTLQQDQH